MHLPGLEKASTTISMHHCIWRSNKVPRQFPWTTPTRGISPKITYPWRIPNQDNNPLDNPNSQEALELSRLENAWMGMVLGKLPGENCPVRVVQSQSYVAPYTISKLRDLLYINSTFLKAIIKLRNLKPTEWPSN